MRPAIWVMKMYIRSENNPALRHLRGAFTLLEVMVSVLVIVIAVVTIFLTMSMGFAMTESSRENLRATQIMLDKMEGIRLYNWSQVTNTGFITPAFTNWFFETNHIGQFNAVGNGVAYTGLVQIVSFPDNSVPYSSQMAEVDVLLGWDTSGSGWVTGTRHHTRSMSTYVANAGMQNYIFNSQ